MALAKAYKAYNVINPYYRRNEGFKVFLVGSQATYYPK